METTETIPVAKEQLDAWSRFADSVRAGALDIRSLVARGDTAGAKESLTDLHVSAAFALSSLHSAGATLPVGHVAPDPVPLNLLSTDANRRLANALREAFEAAVSVDRERGYTDDPEDGPVAMPVLELLARTLEEVHGPAGRGEGAER